MSGSEPSSDFVIAIDGPSGTGKSTVAQRVAKQLNAGYLDTGAMYRVVTLAVLRAGIEPSDIAAVARVLSDLSFESPIDAAIQRHLLGTDDVTAEIRSQPVTLAVTPVSADPAVRAYLFEKQQRLAHSGRMVVEGRDIGTVIAPGARLKIYLTAAAGERAKRRHRQIAGPATDLAAVARDLDRRDSSDRTRTHAPLQAADDAVVLDSSSLSISDTVARVLALAADRGIS